ncbi:hypothetical protein [Rodentibacter pneumotropicus]|uniref:hypothetical protein n=1 Tax=Rodentibacter pneumotropicus TaxID=758 RepID=UPI00036E70CA|nr:hypothetical protein [Rodentibacter pneumotropicus]OOF63657.1 hypothetical protein BH925_08060 [Rodentibacter pneumotropicus]
MQNELTKKEQHLMRRWFRKTDENAIELKEKRWGWIKIILGLILMGGGYYDFIDARYQEMTKTYIYAAFQPTVWFEKEYSKVESISDPNVTRWGEPKEIYRLEADKTRKEERWWGYFIVGKYALFLIYCLWPAKRRVRFDRKRGIIYTYVNNKFYLTEVNKLMRPFPEYIINTGGAVVFWIHPYEYPHKIKILRQGSQMMVSDYTMWLPMLGMIFTLNQNLYKRSSAATLKRFLVDFMNPDTPPERIASMMKALETRPSIFEYLEKILFGWIDGGLYCRKLPKDEILEKEIEKYFAEQAPKIKALPSCRMKVNIHEKVTWKSGYLSIESVEFNRALGFKRVPYKNLYEYPKRSMHSGGFIGGWGNELEDSKYSEKDDLLS